MLKINAEGARVEITPMITPQSDVRVGGNCLWGVQIRVVMGGDGG